MFSTSIGSLSRGALSRFCTLVLATVLLSGLIACAPTATPTVGDVPTETATVPVTVSSIDTPTIETVPAEPTVEATNVAERGIVIVTIPEGDIITTTIPGGDILITIPEREQVEQLIVAALEASSPDPVRDHIPPPQSRVDELEQIVTYLTEQNEIIQQCCDLFDEERTATYSLTDIGVLYQVVSLEEPVDDILNVNGEVLLEPGQGLVIGALLAYDPTFLPQGAGSYLVLLRRTQEGADVELYFFEGVGDVVRVDGVLPWELRRLEMPIDQPLGFITPDQICFSQRLLQVCLNVSSIVTDETREEAQSAVTALINAGLLQETVVVDTEFARTAVAGDVRIEECIAFLQENSQENCQPNLGAMAIDSIFSFRASDDTLEQEIRDGLQSLSIDEVMIGIGVLVVREEGSLDEAVLDLDAQVTALMEGAYRIDLLKPMESPEENLWLAQLTHEDNSVYYTTAREVQLEGELVAPDGVQDETGASEVLLDTFVWSVCDESGQRTPCKDATRKRNYCIDFLGVLANWCDIIEPENK